MSIKYKTASGLVEFKEARIQKLLKPVEPTEVEHDGTGMRYKGCIINKQGILVPGVWGGSNHIVAIYYTPSGAEILQKYLFSGMAVGYGGKVNITVVQDHSFLLFKALSLKQSELLDEKQLDMLVREFTRDVFNYTDSEGSFNPYNDEYSKFSRGTSNMLNGIQFAPDALSVYTDVIKEVGLPSRLGTSYLSEGPNALNTEAGKQAAQITLVNILKRDAQYRSFPKAAAAQKSVTITENTAKQIIVTILKELRSLLTRPELNKSYEPGIKKLIKLLSKVMGAGTYFSADPEVGNLMNNFKTSLVLRYGNPYHAILMFAPLVLSFDTLNLLQMDEDYLARVKATKSGRSFNTPAFEPETMNKVFKALSLLPIKED